MFPMQHQCRPFAKGDFLAPLVETTVLEDDDAGVGTRFAFPHLCDLRLRTQRIADKHRVRKPYVGHPKIRDGSSQSSIRYRQTDHQAKCEDAVDQALTELRRFCKFGVKMKRLRVMGESGEEQVVGLSHGSGNGMRKNASDFEFVVVKPAH